MKIRCIIVEDERVAREGLQRYIAAYDFLELAGSFSHAAAALAFLEKDPVPLVFLDIEMPGMKGTDMARLFDGLFPLIIFTTAYPQYALEGYGVNAIGYLIKPIFPDDFRLAVQKAQRFFGHIVQKVSTSDTELVFRSEGEWLKIPPSDILYLRSMQNYVIIHLLNRKPLMILQPLKETVALLPSFFVQTHRSYVVNIQHVQQLSETHLTIGQQSIPVSRTRKKEVTEVFRGLHQQ